ncbi:unnamed protein product [Closterium sp. NIES-65]|nr:unnamed protein product [Closterium sp. NIES-65]
MAFLAILVSSMLVLAELPTPTRSHGSDDRRIDPPRESRDADASMYIVRLHSAPPLAAYRGEIAGYPAIVTTNSVDDPDDDGEYDSWPTLRRPVGATTGSADSRSEADSSSGNLTLENTSSLKEPPENLAVGRARMSMRASHVRAYAEFLAQMQAEVAAEVGIAADNIAYSYKHIINGFAALLSPAQLRSLARHPAVASARPSRPLRPDTIDSPAFLGLAELAGARNRANRGSGGVWRALGGQRRAGEGMVVGVIDSGIWPEHPSFSDKNFSAIRPNGCAAAGNSGVAMAGGRASGMAPAARLAAYKVFWYSQGDRPEMRALGGESADLLAAVNQAVADGVHVMSISLSADDPDATYIDDVAYMNANLQAKAGVTVVMSAGNNGAPLSNPLGTYRTVSNFSPFYLTVGASSITRGGVSLATSPTPDVEYGSRHASNSLLKPDVIGPGVDLWAAWVGTVPGKAGGRGGRGGEASQLSGTSMATPHLAGIAALIMQKHPKWSPAQVMSAIMTTAITRNTKGRRILNERGVAATPWEMGSGHVFPQRALDPGLTYNARRWAYVNFLAGQDYRAAKKEFPRAKLNRKKAWNLNRPTISVARLKGSVDVFRTVAVTALSFRTAVRGAALSTPNLVAVAPIAPRGLGVSALLNFNNSAAPSKNVPVKKQLRTEDGIFGTSGGFGFTKANELFVGRVAMLGFAASLLGEAVTGQGILSQLNLETGIPITEAEPLLLFFIAFTVLGAIGGLGDRGRFVDDEPAGPPVKPGSFKSALGLSEDGPLFGFTKANELFVGRMAQLGFAASLIGEVVTGRGALAQLNIETGLPVWELEPLLLASIAFFFVAAINPGTGKFINDEE